MVGLGVVGLGPGHQLSRVAGHCAATFLSVTGGGPCRPGRRWIHAGQPTGDYPAPNATPRVRPHEPGRRSSSAEVTLLYGAAACLMLAQLLGIYALKTKKADLIFALCMAGLLAAGAALGVSGTLQQL